MSFQKYSSLEKHLHCEKHNYAVGHETLYDKAMKLYATNWMKVRVKSRNQMRGESFQSQILARTFNGLGIKIFR